jgi:branched-chain amino acid aminotransferase
VSRPRERTPRVVRHGGDGEGAISSGGTRNLDYLQAAAPMISTHLTTSPKPRPKDAELVFGRTFTDHMVLIDYEASRGWFDARLVPYAPIALDPAAAVLHYAQEVFDGLKAFRSAEGRINLFRVDRHCRRMSEGAARLCMPAIDPGLMREALTALVRADRAWVPSSAGTSLYLRPTLIATEPFLGVRPSNRYLFFIIASPVGPYSGDAFAPVKIWVEDRFVRAAPGGLGAVKAGANYVASLLAAEEAKKRGFAQVLWTDSTEHRYLEEVGTMNMVVRIKDELITPPLDGTILGGVTRDSVITLLRDWGLLINERPIGMEEIISAHKRGDLREVFGCGTAAVISPVGELGWKGQQLIINGGGPGDVARRLFDAINGIQHARDPDPHGWLTAID